MKRIILTQQGNDILGSDGLLFIDGRLNFQSIKAKVLQRNKKYKKQFPHKIADGFYFAGIRLEKISVIHNL